MGAGRRPRPRWASAHRRPLPRRSPSLLARKSFGVFRERKRWSARQTRQPGCRPATRKTKLNVVSAPKNRVCPCQSRVTSSHIEVNLSPLSAQKNNHYKCKNLIFPQKCYRKLRIAVTRLRIFKVHHGHSSYELCVCAASIKNLSCSVTCTVTYVLTYTLSYSAIQVLALHEKCFELSHSA